MAKKKITDFDEENEIPILNNMGGAYVFKRGEVWQFRMFLKTENKYVQQSLHTTFKETAKEKGTALAIKFINLMNEGRRHFSITIKEAVQVYLDYKKSQVVSDPAKDGIVIGRWHTISTHLTHFLDFVGRDTRLSDLAEGNLMSYPQWRRATKKAADATIRNEMATINAMMSYLFDQKITSAFRQFHLPKHTRADIDQAQIQRQTFTRKEYNQFVLAMRKYAHEKDLEDDERYARQLARHFFLVASNSAMRTGELAQLKWRNISFEKRTDERKRESVFAFVIVEAKTSKIGKTRKFQHRSGEFYLRWVHDFFEVKNKRKVAGDDIVFSLDGKQRYPNSSLHKHFKCIMELTDIDEDRKNQLVPYSLRHFSITESAKAGNSWERVSKMAGTSITQIERTYFHIDDDEMRRVADRKLIQAPKAKPVTIDDWAERRQKSKKK